MVRNQITAIKKNMGIWLIPGLLALGLILLSGCGGEKNSPAPVEQQPGSSQSAGNTAGEPAPQDPAPASTPPEAPAAAQSQLAREQADKDRKDTTPVPGEVTPVPQSAPAAPPQDDPPKKEPADGAARAEEKTYSFKAGDYFPPFSLSGLNGNTCSSEGLFTANKVTLVNFWATFCGPCIREMPDLEQLQQQYAGQGLGVVGIVLDSQKAETARSMAAKLGTTYPHLLDDGRFAPYFYAVPQTFLVDREGKTLGIATGARTLEQFTQMLQPHL